MAMDIEQVLTKVQKMLNVEGRTPEEAAAYVEKAHAILAQYDLTIEDVGQLKADPRTAVAKTTDTVVTKTAGKPDGWKADLLVYVAQAFECKVIRSGAYEYTKSGKGRWVQHYNIVGFKHDLDAARYAHSFLVGEIIRQAKAYSRVMWDEIDALAKEQGLTHQQAESDYTYDTGSHPLKAELYFIKGATQTVGQALAREAAMRRASAVEINPNALVVQKQDEIDDFIGRERYGDRWEEVKAERARQQEVYAAAAAAREANPEAYRDPEPEAKAETDAQRRKREARERKAYERWERGYYREQAKIDHRALRAGQEAGQGISIRPGIGSRDKEAIG